MRSAPLRFLVLVLGLWIGIRAAMLAPGWPGETDPARTLQFPARPAAPSPISPPIGLTELHVNAQAPLGSARTADAAPCCLPGLRPSPAASWDPPAAFALASPGPSIRDAPALARPPLLAPPPPVSSSGRWSASAWLLARHERGGAALAPGGTLGGSQAGARLFYRLRDGLALTARAYLPLPRTAGAEVAAGLEWRPIRAIPVNILAERRQALGSEGRSAFALTLHGGLGRALSGRLRLDAYGQAGIVGTRSRDMFIDGSVRVSAPIGPVEIGVGAWGAAQPGAARLDAGPAIAYRLPVRANVRIEAGWRFRIAGRAAPGSGPALTLATDF